jgi:N-acyl-D-aspartate/D-glutamate deacylase
LIHPLIVRRATASACAALALGLLGAGVLVPGVWADGVAPPPGTRFLEASVQRPGDPAKGYEYLINGDYVSSGVPLAVFSRSGGRQRR